MRIRRNNPTEKTINKSKRLRRGIRIAAVLAVAFAFAAAFTGCGEKEPVGADVSQGVAGVEYYHFDTTDFYKECDALETLAAGGDADKIINKYDALYKDVEELETLYSVIYIMYSTDVTNDYYSEEQQYSYEQYQKCGDRLCEVCRKITEGPAAQSFRKHVGKEAFDAFAEYEVLTDRQKEIIKEEEALVDEYYETIEAADKATYDYNDKDWTFDMITGEEGNELSVSDYDGYVEIFNGLQKIANDKAGPIFLKLVALRTEFAKESGYDTYAAYADEEEYNRDYTEADIRQLHKDVKKVANQYYDNYYASYDEGSVPDMSEHKLLKTLQKYSDLVDDLAGDSAFQMIDENLISIGDEDRRMDGAFTTYIPKANRPFISMTMMGDNDFITLSHEFGHFVEYNNETRANVLTDEDCVDVAEIASNGLQAIMTCFYDDIYKSDAETAKKTAINNLLENVIDGCLEDEFQRAIYENPDMTLEEINALYAKLYREYNQWAEDDPGYSWVYVNHTFESPMYYISYTVSALAALQIWDQSNRDFDKGVATWERFIEQGTYNQTYLDTVSKCGLVTFTEKGAVSKICKPALKATSSELDFDFEL